MTNLFNSMEKGEFVLTQDECGRGTETHFFIEPLQAG